jgi:hypothetical protein
MLKGIAPPKGSAFQQARFPGALLQKYHSLTQRREAAKVRKANTLSFALLCAFVRRLTDEIVFFTACGGTG